MFIVAVKTALVEGLRAVWYEGDVRTSQIGRSQEAHVPGAAVDPAVEGPSPRRITVEYPEESTDWPAVLVQVRPTKIEWTGITPDEVVDRDGVPVRIRQGYFEALAMLQVLATTSEERDRIWDNLVKLLLMGRTRAATNRFYQSLEEHDLVGITVVEGSVVAAGDSIGRVDFNSDLIAYEAALEFSLVGTFYADEYDEQLVRLSAARVYDYIDFEGAGVDAEPPPGEGTMATLALETDASQDTITVSLAAKVQLPALPFRILAGSERMLVVDREAFVGTEVWAVERGVDGTTASAHPVGTPLGNADGPWVDPYST